jgi:uncharacterized protein YqcC (DUF446 family)
MSILNLFKNKSDKDKRVAEALDEIETELKSIGYWSNNPPDFNVSNFTEAPSFELWLQCIFLPNARDAAKKSEYPQQSQVGLMAMRQYDYHSSVEEAQNLVSLLNHFDKIIESK